MRPPLVILMLCLAGCATYVDRGPRVRVAVEEGDYDTAATVAQNFAAAEPKDALVWNLEAASALRAQGKLKESVRLLEQVEGAFRAEEERPGFSVGGATLAAFSNGYAEAYRPRPADRIYASTYQALNRMEMGDVNGARVSMARLRFVQQAFGSGQLYVKPKGKEEKYDVTKASQDERTKEGLGMIEENLASLTTEGSYDDAFSHWLQGMFFLRLGQDPSDREKGRKELLARRREQSLSLMRALDTARARRVERASDRVGALSARLAPALARVISDAARKTGEGRAKLLLLDARLQAAPAARLAALSERLDSLDRIRTTLGYAETLKRGYAVVRGDGHVVTSKAAAEKALSVEVEFADGRLVLGGKGPRKTKAEGGPTQGSLF